MVPKVLCHWPLADCETFKLPLAKVATSSAENLFGFKVHQLFVGVSSNESLWVVGLSVYVSEDAIDNEDAGLRISLEDSSENLRTGIPMD